MSRFSKMPISVQKLVPDHSELIFQIRHRALWHQWSRLRPVGSADHPFWDSGILPLGDRRGPGCVAKNRLHNLFPIIFLMFFSTCSFRFGVRKSTQHGPQNRPQIGTKSKPTTVAETIGKKIDFGTHFGTIFHRFLINFQDDL